MHQMQMSQKKEKSTLSNCMSESNMHVHMIIVPLHVRNEYACPHHTTPPCLNVKPMFEIWCFIIACPICIQGKLHVHKVPFCQIACSVAKCMSQNCNYANCMSYMQFETEYHVHDLNFFMMALVLACWQHLQATSPATVLARPCSAGAAVQWCCTSTSAFSNSSKRL